MHKEREQVLQSWLQLRQAAVRPLIGRTVAFGFGQYFFVVIQAALLAWIIDQAVMGGTPAADLILPFVLLIGCGLGRALCARERELAGHRAGAELRQGLRSEILDKVSASGPAILADKQAGSWLTLIMEQVDNLHDYYASYLPQMMMVRVLPVLTVILVAPFSWAVALILLFTAPLIILFMIFVGNRAAAASRRNVQALSRLSAHFLDRLQGLSTLKLFDQSQQEKQAIASAAESFRDKTMQVLRMAFLSSTVLEFFTAVSIAMTAVYLGMSYLGHLNFGFWGNHLTLFTGLFLLLLAPEYYLPLRDLGTHYHAKADAIGAADDIETFLKEAPSELSAGETQCPAQQAAGISFQNVSVVTASGRRILDDISFDIAPGKRLAIIGESGAGKTTLLNVLLGFMPYEGTVLVNGISLRNLNLESWRQQVAWLGQNPQLFHGTLRENIVLAAPDASDGQVNEVIKTAHINEFLERLPKGLKSVIGDASAGLSVGQAQRVALARALIKPFQLLVLDEPTASLDSRSASIVSDAVDASAAGRTIVTVSHHPESLTSVDTILMLKDGRAVACGSRHELLETSTEFQHMSSYWQQLNTIETRAFEDSEEVTYV
ncbi:heme ABC transporter permease/ATP-binding protein CydD [Sansalvadorimonas verongulae]|uniref:heme ABC transporter permease/ATP-binding protein CydD n=1 Tax=Sansalvadorimonas verongulae TaxID=2172824 RepID=UPI0012BBD542|nr:cysteine/glutathione ABC transporter permease/ATP-binding protein CydD [Sansalvadorimonas verongulae]MTI15176.1 cysteine/glutathione ABC transporter permease/ATP-binding protein CydD [Sansalvadorimonas verongulae]